MGKDKPKGEDAPPTLSALFKAVAEAPATAEGESSAADAPDEAKATGAAAAATDAAADAPSEAMISAELEVMPTGDYVAPGETAKTEAYHPSVAKLLDRFDEVETADATDPVDTMRDRLTRAREELAAYREQLEESDDGPRALQESILQASEELLSRLDGVIAGAARLVEQLHTDEDPRADDVAAQREEVVQRFFFLRNALAARHSPAMEPEQPRDAPKPAPQKRRARIAPAPDPQARQRKRVVALAVFFGLMLVGRIALLFSEGASAPAVRPDVKRTASSVETTRAAVSATDEEIEQGIPTVISVELAIDARGHLHADYVAADPDGDELEPRYSWYRDGKRLPSVFGPSIERPRSGSYQVEVRVTDGDRVSPALRSEALPVSSQPTEQ